MRLDIDLVRNVATSRGWTEIPSTDPTMLSFTRNGDRINVWYTKATVGTYITHPKQGKTQLFRRDVSLVMLARILNYPRVHTGRGYHQRY